MGADLLSVLKMDRVKGDREVAQCVMVLATKPDNLRTVLRIHMVGREAACPLTPTHIHPYIDTHRLTETTDTPTQTRRRACTHTQINNQ